MSVTMMHELLKIALIIILAKLAGELCERIGQSPILGQILVGIIIGPSMLNFVVYDDVIRILSEIGIIFLIFLVGLQSKPSEIREVGGAATLSAVGGVVFPFVMGFGAAFLMGYDWQEGLILGSSLSATSVAITAGVLMNLGKIRTKVAETILTSAVVDDVIGLLVLTFLVAILGPVWSQIYVSIFLAFFFWAVIFPLGWKLLPKLAILLRRMRSEGGVFVVVVGILFIFAFMAEKAGLATIVGAFIVGMIFAEGKGSEIIIQNTLPLYYFLGPIFFVSVGLLFDISSVSRTPFALVVLTFIAFAGKILGSGLGARASGMHLHQSLFIGFGMIPRGEVALIIASFARSFEVSSGNMLLGNELFSMITGMSMVTILATPLILGYLNNRYRI